MSRLKRLLERCKCGVYLEVNTHRDFYDTAKDKLELLEVQNDLGIPDDVRKVMVETNTLVELTFYPDTPVGSYCIYHYDLDVALDWAMDVIND